MKIIKTLCKYEKQWKNKNTFLILQGYGNLLLHYQT